LIDALGLEVLEDDRHFFPPYDAVIVSRDDIAAKCAAAPAALELLANSLDAATMRRLNYEIDGRHRGAAEVAKRF
jgi:glycine betaine/choline ABC-type transport system substrate-binding protein